MTLPILILDPSAAARLKLWFFRADALFPGASPWMILVHLAVLNGLSARELDALFRARGALRRQTFDRSLTRPVWARAQLADALNIPANVLRPASGFPAHGPAARFTASAFRFCPQCLKQAVHSVIHQWAFVVFCPVHRTPLTTACPGCAEPIDYRLNAHTFNYPGRCPHCLYRLITAAAIERLAVNSPAFLKTLSRLTLELSTYVRQCEDTREIEGLAAWLRCLPATSPSLQLSTPTAGAFPARPTPGFYHPRCLSTADEAERCYRSIRRCLWRRLSRAQQRTLSSWARRHAHPLATPVPALLNSPQLALLCWRLFWEGRSNPLALFRHSRAPYTGLLVWLLYNPDDETRPSLPSLHPEEIRALVKAFASTYQSCQAITTKMQPFGHVTWHNAWLDIPFRIKTREAFRLRPVQRKRNSSRADIKNTSIRKS